MSSRRVKNQQKAWKAANEAKWQKRAKKSSKLNPNSKLTQKLTQSSKPLGVCLLCQKCTLICLVVETCLKFSLYYELNEISNMIISKLQDICRTHLCDPPGSLEVIWGMSNTVISKLQGVCRTQLCNPPRGIEITWGLQMSKFLNLIAYSLACLLTCINWVLSCICECLAKHTSWIFVALFDMMLASLYMLVLVEIGVLRLLVNLLNLLFTSCYYLSSWLLTCYLFVVSCGDSLLFCRSWHNGWV
jgi:hypothetical protein